MTTPAIALAFEVDGQPGLWGVDWLTGPVEPQVRDARPFHPADFVAWFMAEVAEREPRSWLARLLRLQTLPWQVSTAVAVPVRVRASPDGLRRRWVAFSIVDDARLGEHAPPAATRDRSATDRCLFRFAPDEPPFALLNEVELHPAHPTDDDTHAFVDRTSRRRLRLTPTPEGLRVTVVDR